MKNSSFRSVLTSIACVFMAVSIVSAQVSPSYNGETAAQRDVRMKWWREAKFGMFIHFGLYAQLSGSWNGKAVTSNPLGEWIQFAAQIPAADYAKMASQFNPSKFDADAIAKLAKQAGMKYIILTSKHHEGFSMFHSSVSPFNIYDATPFKRDPVAELAAACKKNGLRFGVYYSQAFDWHEPNGVGNTWDFGPDEKKDIDTYLKTKCVPQVKELLTKYGKISVLWFDVPVQMTKERAELFLPLLKLQPGIIINNRLGGGVDGDTETPEQFVPPTGIRGRDWETCMTMNDTWGYKSYDHNWKSTESLVRMLIDAASRGGNLLLNIGPKPTGEVPTESVERLQQIGDWMKVNSSAIYGTSPSPFMRLSWGRCTTKYGKRDTTLYLHVYDWPSDGKLLVPGLMNKPLAASLLHGRKPLTHTQTDEGVIVKVPSVAPDKYSSTVVLRIAGKPDIKPLVKRQNTDGSLTLLADEAELIGNTIAMESIDGTTSIGFWTSAADSLSWSIYADKPGTYTISAEVAMNDPTKVTISVDGSQIECVVPATGDFRKFRTVELGSIDIKQNGKTSLQMKPVAQGWLPMNLRNVVLTPKND